MNRSISRLGRRMFLKRATAMVVGAIHLGFPIAMFGSQPRPEEFDEILRTMDLIGIVRVEEVLNSSPLSVSARVVEVFKGKQTERLIRVIWPLLEKPMVGSSYYAFLKMRDDAAFHCSSYWWRLYKVTERTPSKETLGRKIYHSDCYWVIASDSAVRCSYPKKSTVAIWPVLHVVQTGDSLSGLAGRFYGDKSRWRKILEYNPRITDASKMQAGRSIQIPSISDYD